MPNTPVKPAGMRIDPPPSPPVASGQAPVATATAAPPEEPPGVSAGFQGLRVTPVSGLSFTPFQPRSGMVVRAKMSMPASRSRAMWGWSSASATGSRVRLPLRFGRSFAPWFSLMASGTPSSGPFGSPFIQRASASRAAALAASGRIRLNGLSLSCTRAARARLASSTSTGESFRAR